MKRKEIDDNIITGFQKSKILKLNTDNQISSNNVANITTNINNNYYIDEGYDGDIEDSDEDCDYDDDTEDSDQNDKLAELDEHELVENAVRFLVSESKVAKTDDDGNAALHLIAEYGRFEDVEELLESGTNVNIENIFGDTPLHSAVLNNIINLNVIIELVELRADIHSINNQVHTPINLILKIIHNIIHGDDNRNKAEETRSTDDSKSSSSENTPDLVVAGLESDFEHTNSII